MLPPGGGVGTPHNHVMVYVLSRVPEQEVLEQIVVYPKNVVHPGPHHPPLSDHSLCPAVLIPWLRHRRKWTYMYYSPTSERAAVIALDLLFPSRSTMFAFRSPTTMSAASQGRYAMDLMTCLMEDASSGDRYNSTMN